jgi:hypothetical protein
MAFRVYKPKAALRVRAEQLTKENAKELSIELMGRLTHGENVRGEGPNIIGLQIPRFEDVMDIRLGQWIVRGEDGSVDQMTPAEFDEQYELAKVTRAT